MKERITWCTHSRNGSGSPYLVLVSKMRNKSYRFIKNEGENIRDCGRKVKDRLHDEILKKIYKIHTSLK